MFIEHYGTKGMRWGVRKASQTSEDRVTAINKRLNRFSGQKIFEGAGYTGHYAQKGAKNPRRRANIGIALRGAAEVAAIIGGSQILMNKMNLSPSVRVGGDIAFGLLAGQTGAHRISQIAAVEQYNRHAKLIKERDTLVKEIKKRGA